MGILFLIKDHEGKVLTVAVDKDHAIHWWTVEAEKKGCVIGILENEGFIRVVGGGSPTTPCLLGTIEPITLYEGVLSDY